MNFGPNEEIGTGAAREIPRPALRHECKIIFILASIAAVRVFFFCAAFPFFNNVDEQYHFDSVIRHSHGDFPHQMPTISAEAADSIALYGTFEYLNKPDRFENGNYPPPIWTLPETDSTAARDDISNFWQSRTSSQAKEPPLYYSVAGAWLNFGRALRIKGGALLYWIRFLNLPIIAALVWVGYAAGRVVFPNELFPRLALPALVAVWPHDMFYSIQSDLFSPLCAGLAFLALCHWMRADASRTWPAFVAGLATGASCLTKLSNVPFAAVASLAAIAISWSFIRRGEVRSTLFHLAFFFLPVVLLLGAWALWNYHIAGDLTGTSEKIHFLGWNNSPANSQPSVLTIIPNTWWSFWSALMTNYWRGEFFWKGHLLASSMADYFYAISSSLLLGLAVATLFGKHWAAMREQQRALLLATFWFIAGVAFLGAFSIIAGRLMSGSLIPFLLLYARGLDLVTARIKWMPMRLAFLAIIAAVIIVPDSILNFAAVASPYNFFHL